MRTWAWVEMLKTDSPMPGGQADRRTRRQSTLAAAAVLRAGGGDGAPPGGGRGGVSAKQAGERTHHEAREEKNVDPWGRWKAQRAVD